MERTQTQVAISPSNYTTSGEFLWYTCYILPHEKLLPSQGECPLLVQNLRMRLLPSARQHPSGLGLATGCFDEWGHQQGWRNCEDLMERCLTALGVEQTIEPRSRGTGIGVAKSLRMILAR